MIISSPTPWKPEWDMQAVLEGNISSCDETHENLLRSYIPSCACFRRTCIHGVRVTTLLRHQHHAEAPDHTIKGRLGRNADAGAPHPWAMTTGAH